jgi:surfactin synthase thioesterase subunit
VFMGLPRRESCDFQPQLSSHVLRVVGCARSEHAGPHTIAASAQDLHSLLGGRSPDVMVGHSMGGKVVLEYLALMKDSHHPPPQQTWMLDAMPGVVSGDPHNAMSTLETLRVLPQVRFPPGFSFFPLTIRLWHLWFS